jgi:hypothetical protein
MAALTDHLQRHIDRASIEESLVGSPTQPVGPIESDELHASAIRRGEDKLVTSSGGVLERPTLGTKVESEEALSADAKRAAQDHTEFRGATPVDTETVQGEDLAFATLYQSLSLEHILDRLRTSTRPDSRDRAVLVAYLEKLLPGREPETEPEPERAVEKSLPPAHWAGILARPGQSSVPIEELSLPRSPEPENSNARAGKESSGTAPQPLEAALCLVLAQWDAEAGVWVATSDDVPGLVTEAASIEALRTKLVDLVPDLLRADAA